MIYNYDTSHHIMYHDGLKHFRMHGMWPTLVMERSASSIDLFLDVNKRYFTGIQFQDLADRYEKFLIKYFGSIHYPVADTCIFIQSDLYVCL